MKDTILSIAAITAITAVVISTYQYRKLTVEQVSLIYANQDESHKIDAAIHAELRLLKDRIAALENRPAKTESDFAKNWKRHGLSVTNGIYVTPTPAEQAEIDRMIEDWNK